MALISPGVQVSVIDESFYTPAEAGTRPLIILASAENKSTGSGTGTAKGTLAANAGKVFTVTSQRELVELFGDPLFRTDSNNNPIHAGELNEYGLQAAYSFLGISNSVLVVRADIDLNELQPSDSVPGGEPINGTFWLDTGASKFGVFEWNGEVSGTGAQSFTSKTPAVILDAEKLDSGVPKTSVGVVGSYALAPGAGTNSHVLTLYYKNRSNDWVIVGSKDWAASWPTVKPSTAFTGTITGTDPDFTINGQTVNISTNATLNDIVSAINSAAITGVSAANVSGYLEIYSTGISITLADASGEGSALTQLGLAAGVYPAPALAMQKHTQVPQWKSSGSNQVRRPSGAVWVKTTEPNSGASWRVKKYNSTTKLWDTVTAPLYQTSNDAITALDPINKGLKLAVNSAYVQYDVANNNTAVFKVLRRSKSGPTTLKSTTGTIAAGDYYITLRTAPGGTARIPASGTVSVSANDPVAIVNAIIAANLPNLEVSYSETTKIITLTNTTGGEIDLGGDSAVVNLFASNMYTSNQVGYSHTASNWAPLTITSVNQSYYIQSTAPQTLTEDGALWYSSVVDEVDILVHNGNTWVGYRNYDHGTGAGETDINGPIVAASQPTAQSSGDPLVTGDLWIDTSILENYPTVKRWNSDLQTWITLDKGDQTTENGVLFADVRWSTSGDSSSAATISSLLLSNYVDFDAPDPALYPRGMLLWNLRRSGFNVKKFVKNYIDVTGFNNRYDTVNSPAGSAAVSGEMMDDYYPHRWVTESANQADGSGSFGRHAQRKVVTQSMQALVNKNQAIRDTERNDFTLLACPGYPELIGEMITLNYDRGLTAFVIGDTPARLTPDATTVNNWGTNLAGALEDNDRGLASSDEYLGVFYPWGFTSDNAGRDIAVPPSYMIMRMIALSDQVSYPWFAPAGTRRGGITNATAVGYISSEGEFVSVALNEGQRDTLYKIKVNPITFFVGSGLVNFGQKTRARNASALDRINVARLVIYLRRQLDKLAKPYIFEPNDKNTRDEIKQQVESLLVELQGNRALTDYIVVCDESNNTPNRIDRNELHVDVALVPVKAVEFIYIPIRLKNTGEI